MLVLRRFSCLPARKKEAAVVGGFFQAENRSLLELGRDAGESRVKRAALGFF
jgi:hypothetical protein